MEDYLHEKSEAIIVFSSMQKQPFIQESGNRSFFISSQHRTQNPLIMLSSKIV